MADDDADVEEGVDTERKPKSSTRRSHMRRLTGETGDLQGYDDDFDIDSAASEVVDKRFTLAFVDTATFSLFMGGVVLSNTVIIGLQVEGGQEAESSFEIVNNIFLLIYLLELALRFLAHGRTAIADRFILLDIGLVLLTFMENLIASSSIAKSLPSIRLLRLLRLFRTFKALAKSKEFLLLMTIAVKALLTLLWMVIFLLSFAWACSSCLHIFVGESIKFNESMNPLVPHEAFTSFDRHEYFGSMMRTFFTSIQIITRAQWAGHVGRPVFIAYPISALFFFIFIMLTSYGLCQTIISNIVQDAIETSRVFTAAKKQVEKENRESFANDVKRILQVLDVDDRGRFDEEVLDEALADPEVIRLLKELEVPVLGGEEFLRLFDKAGVGSVDQAVLVNGLVDLAEDITSRDYIILSFWSESLLARVLKLERRLRKVEHKIVSLRIQLEAAFGSLKTFISSRDNTELYYRALRSIRQAPPPIPTSVAEATGTVIRECPPDIQTGSFMNFANRYLPPAPSVAKRRKGAWMIQDESSSDEKGSAATSGLRISSTFVNSKAVLGDPPSILTESRATAKREEAARQEHDLRFYIDKSTQFRTRPSTLAVKAALKK